MGMYAIVVKFDDQIETCVVTVSYKNGWLYAKPLYGNLKPVALFKLFEELGLATRFRKIRVPDEYVGKGIVNIANEVIIGQLGQKLAVVLKNKNTGNIVQAHGVPCFIAYLLKRICTEQSEVEVLLQKVDSVEVVEEFV